MFIMIILKAFNFYIDFDIYSEHLMTVNICNIVLQRLQCIVLCAFFSGYVIDVYLAHFRNFVDDVPVYVCVVAFMNCL